MPQNRRESFIIPQKRCVSRLISAEYTVDGPSQHLHIVNKRNYWEYRTRHQDIEEFLTKVFLPAGYPQTVTPGEHLHLKLLVCGLTTYSDYLKYEFLSAL